MASNVEIKARVEDLDRVRHRARALDVREQFELAQTDTFFNAPAGRLKLREFGDGRAELIAYDRPDTAGPKHSRYQKIEVTDPAAMAAALDLALGKRGVVRKHREVLIVGRTRIHLDEVDGLGTFVELEVMMREGPATAEGERIANELLAQLAIDSGDLISCAYIDLLEAKNE